jgi:radical SAM protein with 4Fe4S-binding SPASM domain
LREVHIKVLEESENNMKECFGTIYPDVSQVQFGKEMVGKVFRFKIDTVGPFQRDRKLETDTKAWEECQQCELYRSCYDFSTGKLLMQQFMIQV